MRNKILLLLLTVALLLSAVACADNSTEAYTMYTAARELYTAGYEAAVGVKVDGLGGTVSTRVQGDFVATENSERGHARYYVNGISYQSGYLIEGTQYDDKIKLQSTKEDFLREHMQFFGINPYAAFFPVFTEEQLKDVKMTTSGSYRSFSAALTTEMIQTYFGDVLVLQGEGTMTASFDREDHMRRMALAMTVTYADGKQRTIEIVYDFANHGLVPGVMAPENANEYIEI